MRDGFAMNDASARVPGATAAPDGSAAAESRGAAGADRREIVLAQEKAFRLADTVVRPAGLELEFASQTTSIEPRVMQVLVALSRNGGAPVSRETLIDCCWGGRVVTDGALNRSIAQLRKALRDPGIQVDTIAKVGYRLQAVAASPVSDALEAVASVDGR